jgi:SAM-dependent methyltransferase
MQTHLEAVPASSLHACRSCGSRNLTVFLDLGCQPIANALLDEAHLAEEEPRFPLQLAFCKDCALVQVTETVAPDILFGRDYPYFSSYSPALLAHSREHVSRIMQERLLDTRSLVVEVASNDGYLLSNFVEAGVPVLGIDPAIGPVEAALRRGVPTWQAFFGADLARDLAGSGKQADVLIANNVAAHVDTINDFIQGIAILLKDDGFARIEVAYLRDLIEKCEFDTIYHEHLFYHSVTAFEPLLRRHGLHLNDAERITIHGGSIRLTASKKPGRSQRLEELLEEEAALGMGEIYYYESFAERVEGVRRRLREWIGHKHDDGARLAGYGAAAKGATLLNYVQFDPGTVEYVVDRHPAKVGKYMPGVKLPIRTVETLLTDRPHFLLLLAWNFAAEIMRQNKAYIDVGGRFILPNV